jgi:hypothetical protein
MKIIRIVLTLLASEICLASPAALADGTAADYLITNDIVAYQKFTKGGSSGDYLDATGHFSEVNEEAAYGIIYLSKQYHMRVNANVSVHGGTDNDRWLLHEVEKRFRAEELGNQIESGASIRAIGSYTIFFYEHPTLGGADYQWISANNIVVSVSCNACNEPGKPEPLEVVQAYLAKHPSTITLTDAQLKSHAHSVQWLRDEMERRVWLAEKWLPLAKGDNSKVENVVDNLIEFLKYRDKYLGKSGKNDAIELGKYNNNKDIESLEKKLKSLREWWNDHKTESLSNVP